MIKIGLIFFSVIFFASSAYLYIKKSSFRKVNLLYCLMVFLFFVYTIFYTVIYFFTGEGINIAAIYHLRYGISGAGFGEYIKLIMMSVFLFFSGIAFAYWLYVKNKKKLNEKNTAIYTAYIIIVLSFLTHPATMDFFNLYKDFYLIKETADFNEYYKKPEIREDGEKKNLVFIYAEGMERTYFNEDIFPELMTELKKIEDESVYFTNIDNVSGTGWTIAGIVASQCGIPLLNPNGENEDVSETNKFLPSAICIGDLLHQEGYNITYYGGAKLSFAGKGDFYFTHSFDNVYGLKELKPKVEDKARISKWGINDDLLFNFAFEDFIKMAETGKKQALFLLTLDMHDNNGLPSKEGCKDIVYGDGSNPMLNTVKCSDMLISQFVNKIRNSAYGPETVIVVASDHLAMSNSASNLLKKSKEGRKNTFMISAPGVSESKEVNKLGSTLDIGPTILPFLGFKSQIGLGRNLIGDDYSDSEIKTIHSNIIRWSKVTTRFWDLSEVIGKK